VLLSEGKRGKHLQTYLKIYNNLGYGAYSQNTHTRIIKPKLLELNYLLFLEAQVTIFVNCGDINTNQ
jgi:hypothetical protein